MELLVGLVKMAKSLTTCHLEIKSFLSAEGSLSNWPTGTERCQEGNGEKMRSSQGFQGCEALTVPCSLVLLHVPLLLVLFPSKQPPLSAYVCSAYANLGSAYKKSIDIRLSKQGLFLLTSFPVPSKFTQIMKFPS